MDKENQPIRVERSNDESHVLGDAREEKRRAVVEDIEMDETGSITRRDSIKIQQLLSQSQSGRSSIATNQISDIDESVPFMNGSRDTADEGILMGIADLYNKYWGVCWRSKGREWFVWRIPGNLGLGRVDWIAADVKQLSESLQSRQRPTKRGNFNKRSRDSITHRLTD